MLAAVSAAGWPGCCRRWPGWGDINVASIEHSHLMPRELMLARIAALVAVDAPPASYLANAGAAADSGVTEQDVQDVPIAVAPITGTARVVSAGGNLMRALGLARGRPAAHRQGASAGCPRLASS